MKKEANCRKSEIDYVEKSKHKCDNAQKGGRGKGLASNPRKRPIIALEEYSGENITENRVLSLWPLMAISLASVAAVRFDPPGGDKGYM